MQSEFSASLQNFSWSHQHQRQTVRLCLPRRPSCTLTSEVKWVSHWVVWLDSIGGGLDIFWRAYVNFGFGEIQRVMRCKVAGGEELATRRKKGWAWTPLLGKTEGQGQQPNLGCWVWVTERSKASQSPALCVDWIAILILGSFLVVAQLPLGVVLPKALGYFTSFVVQPTQVTSLKQGIVVICPALCFVLFSLVFPQGC